MSIARPAPTLRTSLCLAVAVSLVGVGAAQAVTKPKPKPVCKLLVDPAADADGTFVAAGVLPISEDGVDIVSGDVAADTRFLTTVLRVKKLSTSSPTAPGGLHWKFFVTVGGEQIYTQAIAPAGGSPIFAFGKIDETSGTSTQLGPASGKIDLAKSEVRVSVPIKSLPMRVKLGTRIDTLEPNAGRYFGAPSGSPSLSDSTDTATSTKTYRVGTLSCVKPGA
ncbi:MAG TPA: hypothetical protein VMZ11_09620 [Mycobacteriales bacterium]|nr:hypothetical protein [Mycobacteriales bacterium]